MSFWPQFWTWFLVVSLVLFVGLAVVVAIGGFFDIKAMFRSLRQRHEEESR